MTGRRIAVVGSGVSGITAGYVLARTNHVTLFEADDRLGGHADTHPIGADTGFIVYNERTYPLLTRLFAELGVATQPSQMSMSVRCAGCGLQYAGQRGLSGLPRGRGRYLRLLAEVPRFHRAARRLLAHGDYDGQVLADFLRTGGFSRYFAAHFAVPLVAAVWSCPTGTAPRAERAARPPGRAHVRRQRARPGRPLAGAVLRPPPVVHRRRQRPDPLAGRAALPARAAGDSAARAPTSAGGPVTSTSTYPPGTVDPDRWPDVTVAVGSPARAAVARVLFGAAVVRLPLRVRVPDGSLHGAGGPGTRSCASTGPGSSSAGWAPPA